MGGAVDAGYRLGAGDQLQLVITGDLEFAAGLEIRRDGSVVIPQIGQVSIGGLTLEAARVLLTRRAARVFALLGEGKAHLDLSVTRVRTNQVFVAGEVERPGSYQISALATVFRALVAAGGPTSRGTFRNIEVRRGGVVVGRIDLYDYLLRGDASNDIRMEQNDIVFVGLSKRQVSMTGAVRRPSTFELRDAEGFGDLLTFAGGLLPTAVTERLQIDRVLPPAARRPGMERAVIDIPFNGDLAMLETAKVFDSDIVSIFSIGNLRRNRVELRGEVFQPGVYEWKPGLTLGSLLDKGQGFRPWALTDRVKVERPLLNTGRFEIRSLDALDSANRRLELLEFDIVTILDGRIAFPAGKVDIEGAVYSPGSKPFRERESLKDVIDVANGLQPWALQNQVILTRTEESTGRRRQYSFDLNDSTSGSFALKAADRIDVLDARTATIAATVSVNGAVVKPGVRAYVENQSLKEVIALAGGFTLQATGVEVATRNIGTSYSDTVAKVRFFPVLPGGRIGNNGDNVVMERGDHVSVRDNPGFRAPLSVTLSGLFTYPGAYILTRDGDRISDIVARAGGPLPSAFTPSGRLIRQGRPVAIDLSLALKGDREHNIPLKDGDVLSVGADESVVYVTGAVERSVVVPFRRGWDVAEYIAAAGGFSPDAQQDNLIVEYPSGEIRRRVRHLLYSTGDITVVSGSTITVGHKPDEKPSIAGETLIKIVGITTTLVSIFLAYKTATR